MYKGAFHLTELTGQTGHLEGITNKRISLTKAVEIAKNANFPPEANDDCLPNFEIFGENEFLETNDNLHDN